MSNQQNKVDNCDSKLNMHCLKIKKIIEVKSDLIVEHRRKQKNIRI